MLGEKVLSDKYAEKLYAIFEKKSWAIQESDSFSVFDRFCNRLAELESDEDRDLIIELTSDFLWLRSTMYEEYLIIALKKLFDSSKWKVEKGQTIYICPLIQKKDFGTLKSTSVMLYLCQSILLRTFPEFQENQVRICETPVVLNKHKDNVDSLILIDDFIGSGETALDCLEYLNFLKAADKKIFIVSLVAQQEGINSIYDQKIQVFTAITRKRGITDAYSKLEASIKLERMMNISKYLRAPKGMQLGYADTESLVAMIKTPNNTFPVYWFEKKNNMYAPFPRKENVKVIRS